MAYNGGVMVTSVQKGNKSLDQLPKEVIVVAYTDQLVDRLNEGLSLIREKYGKDIPTRIGTLHGMIQLFFLIDYAQLLLMKIIRKHLNLM